MPKKRSRPGNNPSLKEVQLKGMLQALSLTAEKLENTNKVLTTEAAAVLEVLWNGHQELVLKVEELCKRLKALEIPESPDEEETGE